MRELVPVNPAGKTCWVCEIEKPANGFHVDASRRDGLQGRCKKCSKELSARHYAANKDAYRKRNQRYRCEHDKPLPICFSCRPETATKAAKRSAEQRGYSWGLTDKQVIFVATQPCIYCGKTPANGIDRQKNEYGYTVLNSVPCCGQHNMMKGTMPQKGFILACKAVATHCVSKEDFVARTNKLQQELKEFEQWQKNPNN